MQGENLAKNTSVFGDVGNMIQLKEVIIKGSGEVPEEIRLRYAEPTTYEGDDGEYTAHQTEYEYPTTQTTNTGDPNARAGDTMVYLMGDRARAVEEHPNTNDNMPYPKFENGVNMKANERITQQIINDLLVNGYIDWDGGINLGGVQFLQ